VVKGTRMLIVLLHFGAVAVDVCMCVCVWVGVCGCV